MNMLEIFGEVIGEPYTLSKAIENGDIKRLDEIDGHQADCKQHYNCPVYITKALYGEHEVAALKAANNDEALSKKIIGWSIFDMLQRSTKSYRELSDSIRKFEYHLQKDEYTFSDEILETISQCGGDDEGKMIITFMLPNEL